MLSPFFSLFEFMFSYITLLLTTIAAQFTSSYHQFDFSFWVKLGSCHQDNVSATLINLNSFFRWCWIDNESIIPLPLVLSLLTRTIDGSFEVCLRLLAECGASAHMHIHYSSNVLSDSSYVFAPPLCTYTLPRNAYPHHDYDNGLHLCMSTVLGMSNLIVIMITALTWLCICSSLHKFHCSVHNHCLHMYMAVTPYYSSLY